MADSGIAERAMRCQRILSHLVRKAEADDEKSWAETQAQRLEVWIETLGMRAHAEYSIEHRLASNQQVSNVIKQLLDALSTNLCLYVTASTHETLPEYLSKVFESVEPVDDPESSDDAGSAASEAIEPTREDIGVKIDAGLSRLGQLAVRLRREGSRRAAQAALYFVPVDASKEPLESRFRSCVKGSLLRTFPIDRGNESSNQLSLTGRHTRVARWKLSTLSHHFSWPAPRSDTMDTARIQSEAMVSQEPPYIMPDYLRDRLVDTMVRRWTRICYNRDQAQQPPRYSAQRHATKNHRQAELFQRTSGATRLPTQLQKVPKAKGVIIEHTTESPEVKFNMNIYPKQPSKSIITKVRSSALEYPRPPNTPDGVDSFTCPLCKLSLPTQLLMEGQWQIHVMQDLAPYLCVIKHCPSATETYSTNEELSHHIRTEHMQSSWLCTSCANRAIFSSSQAFETHLKMAHSDEAISSQIPFLTKLAENKEAYVYAECYFCGFVPAGYENDRGNGAAQDVIKDHMIVDHMKALALDCLPWDYSEDSGNSLYQEDLSRSTESEVTRDKMLADAELTQLLQDALDSEDRRNEFAATSCQADLKEIRARWDDSLNARQAVEVWLSADRGSSIEAPGQSHDV